MSRRGAWPRGLLLVFAALLAVLLLIGAWTGWQWWYRPGMDQLLAHQLPVSQTHSNEQLQITWLGVSTLLISDGETTLLTDPFVSRPPLAQVLLNRPLKPDAEVVDRLFEKLGLQRIQAILVGHSHYDHIMDVGLIGARSGALLVGSASSVNIALGHGLPEAQTLQIEADTPIQIGEFSITFIPARHAGATGGRPLGDVEKPLASPARGSDYKQGGSYSILIAHPRAKLLYHGCAGFIPGALQPYSADAVLLGIALLPELNTYLEQVVDAVGAQTVIPVHWDDFTRPLDAPLEPLPFVVKVDQFFEQMREQRPDLRILTLPLAQPVVWPPE